MKNKRERPLLPTPTTPATTAKEMRVTARISTLEARTHKAGQCYFVSGRFALRLWDLVLGSQELAPGSFWWSVMWPLELQKESWAELSTQPTYGVCESVTIER